MVLVTSASSARDNDDVGLRNLAQAAVGGQPQRSRIGALWPGLSGDEEHFGSWQSAEHLIGSNRVKRGQTVEKRDGDLHDSRSVREGRNVRSKGVAADCRHTLVVYGGGNRADTALAELARRVGHRSGRLTVLALALEEPTSRRCCDTRSVLWNAFMREFAENDLARARGVVDDAADVEFAMLRHNGRRVGDAVAREARRRGADEIVLADPKSGLTRRERRRLRRDAAVPVTA